MTPSLPPHVDDVVSGTRAGKGDEVITRPEMKDVIAFSVADQVAPAARLNDVVIATRHHLVTAGPHRDSVRPVLGRDSVGDSVAAAAAVQDIVPAAPTDRVSAAEGPNRVVSSAGLDHVTPRGADDLVAARRAHNRGAVSVAPRDILRPRACRGRQGAGEGADYDQRARDPLPESDGTSMIRPLPYCAGPAGAKWLGA